MIPAGPHTCPLHEHTAPLSEGLSATAGTIPAALDTTLSRSTGELHKFVHQGSMAVTAADVQFAEDAGEEERVFLKLSQVSLEW